MLNILHRSVEYRGKNWLLMKAAEECAELSAAILQHLNKEASEEDIQKEMADVGIALDHLEVIYGTSIVAPAKTAKWKAIQKKLEEHNE